MERAREQGYVISRAENFNKPYATGVTATRRSGDVVNGFSATGPAHLVTDEDRKAEPAHTVKDIVNKFELEFAFV